MSRAISAGTPEGAGIVSGDCRGSRRRGNAPRGKEWVRLYKLAQRELDNSASMIISSVRSVADAGCCADRPVESSRKIIRALRQTHVAAEKHARAEHHLTEAVAALAQTPPELRSEDAPELLERAAERCETVHRYISVAAKEAVLGQLEILQSVASGEAVPEEPSPDRPRRRVIVIRHNPLFVRTFLAPRRQHAADRITPLLQRRRRTRLPAEVRVPKRGLRGRAPPLSSTCPL